MNFAADFADERRSGRAAANFANEHESKPERGFACFALIAASLDFFGQWLFANCHLLAEC
jgi:hypothetical protein